MWTLFRTVGNIISSKFQSNGNLFVLRKYSEPESHYLRKAAKIYTSVLPKYLKLRCDLILASTQINSNFQTLKNLLTAFDSKIVKISRNFPNHWFSHFEKKTLAARFQNFYKIMQKTDGCRLLWFAVWRKERILTSCTHQMQRNSGWGKEFTDMEDQKDRNNTAVYTCQGRERK